MVFADTLMMYIHQHSFEGQISYLIISKHWLYENTYINRDYINRGNYIMFRKKTFLLNINVSEDVIDFVMERVTSNFSPNGI